MMKKTTFTLFLMICFSASSFQVYLESFELNETELQSSYNKDINEWEVSSNNSNYGPFLPGHKIFEHEVLHKLINSSAQLSIQKNLFLSSFIYIHGTRGPPLA